MSSPFRPLAVVATVAAAVLFLGGCAGTVSEADLEEGVAGNLFTGFGSYPAVSCDGDLPAEVDATTTCSAFYTDTLERVAVVVTVTEVNGSSVEYRIEPTV